MTEEAPMDETQAALDAGVRDIVGHFVSSETHALMRKMGATRGGGAGAILNTGLSEVFERLPGCEEKLINLHLDLGVRDARAISERVAEALRSHVAAMGFSIAATIHGHGGGAARRRADRFKASVEARASGVAGRALVAVETQRRKDGAMTMKPIDNAAVRPPRPRTLAELLPHNEATWLDWKGAFPPGLSRDIPQREQHRAKLLKSLVSIANSIVDECGYLVYGVDSENGPRHVVGVTEHFDDAEFQDWNQRTFSPPVQFHYREEQNGDGKTVAMFEITPASNFPHVSKLSRGNELYEGQVWIRRGSMNTVATHDDLKRLFASPEPLRTTESNGPVVQQVRALWEPEGWELWWPGVHERDDYLAKGHRLAYAPYSRREIRQVHSNTDVHVLMLRPKSS
jgi:hypothetical protein